MRSFTYSDLETFMRMLNVTNLKERGSGQYLCSCPMGANHASGVDKNPSFTLIMGDPPGFKCFGGCQTHGTIRKLAKLWNEYCGDSRPLEFIRSFDENKSYGVRAKDRGTYLEERQKKTARNARRKKIKENKPVDEDMLKMFLEKVPLEFALGRNLTKSQILRWEIGYDDQQDRMILPVRDIHGRLFGVSGRALSEETKPKYRHYQGFSKESVLYGERFIDKYKNTCYLVEGFFDVLGLERQGLKNVLGTMGTSLSETQIKTLFRWFSKIIFLPDADTAGLIFAIEASRKLLPRLPKNGKVGIAGVVPNHNYIWREKVVGKWMESDFKFSFIPEIVGKDPDNLSAEDLKVVLENIQWIKLIE